MSHSAGSGSDPRALPLEDDSMPLRSRAPVSPVPVRSVGVVGLGAMGSAVARHLVRAGFEVHGVDVDAHRREASAADGVLPARDARQLASSMDAVLTLLPSVAALESVVEGGDGLVAGARPGLIVVEMSTLPLATKHQARARLAEAGSVMLDAPISGTGAQARDGDLAVYASGDSQAYASVEPMLRSFARSVTHVGEFGAGSKLKFVANLLVAVHNVAAAEAMALAAQAGLDPARTLETITAGAGTSRMLEVRGPMMVDRTYAPATMSIRLFDKDLGIIGDFARELGSPVSVFAAAVEVYRLASAAGLQDLDTAAVYEVLAERGMRAADG